MTIPPDPRPPSRPRGRTGGRPRWRRAARWLGWLALPGAAVAGTVLTVLRLFPRLHLLPGGPYLSAFAPYGLFCWALVALLLLALTRGRWRRVPVLVAAGLAGLHLSWLLPFYVANATPPGGRPITIASANIFHSAPDADVLARATAGADIVVVLEYDPASARVLQEGGWYARYSYRVGAPDAGAAGTTVFSRFPLRELDARRSGVQVYAIEVSPPGSTPFVLVAAHPLNPAAGPVLWHAYGDLVLAAANRHPDGPMIVIGDFNATPDQFTIRQLVDRAGLRNAADESGSGWLRTWPADHWGPLPPLISLDQAFVRGPMYADRVATTDLPGSDHRGIVVRVRVAGSPDHR